MSDADYAYAVARVRSNELRLLSRQDIDSLLAAGDCAKCAARLSDKGWDNAGADADDSRMLQKERERTWALIDEIAPDGAAFDFLRVPNDFHNLKVALKARLQRAEWKSLCVAPCSVPTAVIEKAVSDKNFELLPEYMRAPAQKAYDALIAWADGQLCEIILDRAAIETSLSLAREQGGLVLELTELDAFASDIRIAVRAARMKKSRKSIRSALADCGSIDAELLADHAAEGEGSILEYLSDARRDAFEALKNGLPEFERWCRRQKEALLESHKYDILGIAPLVSYILARQEEERTVRIILAGKRNGVDNERIRAML